MKRQAYFWRKGCFLFLAMASLVLFFSCEDVSNSGGTDEVTEVSDDDLMDFLNLEAPGEISKSASDMGDYEIPELFDEETYEGIIGYFGDGTEATAAVSRTRSIDVNSIETIGENYYIFLYNEEYFNYIKEDSWDDALTAEVPLCPGVYRAMMLVTDIEGGYEYLLASTVPVTATIEEGKWTQVDLGYVNTPKISFVAPESITEGSGIQIDVTGDLMNPNLLIEGNYGVVAEGYEADLDGYADEDSYYLDNLVQNDDGTWEFTYIGAPTGADVDGTIDFKVLGGKISFTDDFFDDENPIYLDSDLFFCDETAVWGLSHYLSADLGQSDAPAYIYDDVIGSIDVTSVESEPFVTEWTTSPRYYGCYRSNYIELPLLSTGEYDFVVDWGDGTTDHITSYKQAEKLHIYDRGGRYKITITGTLKGWSFARRYCELKCMYGRHYYYIESLKLSKVLNWGDFDFANASYHFAGCAFLTIPATDAPEVSDATSLFASFYLNCSLTDIPGLEEWDTSSVERMDFMFAGSISYDQDLSGLDVSGVDSFYKMFLGACSYDNGDNEAGLENWAVKDGASTWRMFACTAMDSTPSWY